MSESKHDTDPIGSWSIKAGLDEILKKSCALMARRGFHGTTMRELAHETGRSLSGLYHYFRSKEDLLFLINYHGFRTLNETWQKMEATFDHPQERLYAFVFSHTRYFCEHIDEMRVMTWGTHELTLDKAKIIEKLKDRYTDAAMKIVKDVHRSLTDGDIDDKRLSRETFILFGMMNWIFGWYSPAAHGDVGDLVGDMYTTFVYGLASCNDEESDLSRLNTKVSRWFETNGAASMWVAGE